MDDKIRDQILSIRNTGAVNMMDARRVQVEANKLEFSELVIYIEEHRHDYVSFILYGENST